MEKIQFENEEVRRLYEEKIDHYEKLANSPVNDINYLWDASVKRYAVTMERVKGVLEYEGMR